MNQLDQIRSLGEKLPIPWVYCDAAGYFRYANGQALAMVGRSLDTFVGLHYTDVLDDESERAVIVEVISAALQGTAGGFDRFRPDHRIGGAGRWFHMHVTPERDDQQVVVGFYLLAIDIHDKRLAELLARETSDRFQKHVDTSAAAFVELDEDMRIQRWSKRAAEMFLVSVSDAVGRTPRELGLIAPEAIDAVELAHRARISEGRNVAWSNRNRNLRADGSEIWCDWHHSQIQNSAAGASVLAIGVDVTAEVLARRALDESLLRDFLTGLPNRYGLQHRFDQRSPPGAQALICINLKSFRHINHQFGFGTADRVLCEIAERLQHLCADHETVARHSGVDYLILVDADMSEKGLVDRAREIIDEVEKPVQINEITINLLCTTGISLSSAAQHSFHELLRQAKIAANAAQVAQAEKVNIYSRAEDEKALFRHDRAQALRTALARDEITTYFQPIVDVASLRVTGAECLARWRHADGSWIPPSEFVAIAEDFGLIHALGLFVFSRSCEFAVRMNACGGNAFVVSVNVSPLQLTLPDFPAQLAQILKQTNARPDTLLLEITESHHLDADEMANVLRTLVDGLGLKCVIDDFGAGYSNLRRLFDLPISGVKIDYSIVIRNDDRSRQLVAAITYMAKGMGISVTAEGVENVETLMALQALGCHSFQGFLFSPAIDEDTFAYLFGSGGKR